TAQPDVTAPLYGTLIIGPAEAPMKFPVMLDQPEGKPEVIYLDLNRNGDFTDDPEVKLASRDTNDASGIQYHKNEAPVTLPLEFDGTPFPARVFLYRLDMNDERHKQYKHSIMYYADYGREDYITLAGEKYHAYLW